MVTRWALNSRHPATYQCTRGVERKMRRLVEADMRESLEGVFEVYGEPLENMTVFKYLVRVLTAGDCDWLALVGNLSKSR